MTIADRTSSTNLDRRIGLADEGRGRRPKGWGVRVAIVVSLAFHAGLAGYLWRTRFEPKYQAYSEEPVTELALVKPAPPPPPPPPPKVETPPEPPKVRTPPRVQPRPPRPTPQVAPVAPLPLPPVVKRLELPKAPPRAVTPPAPAPAPPPPPRPATITQPDWLRLPSADDIARYYPDRAQRRGIEGRATIRCTVDLKGRLRDCQATAESPATAGFGEAAVRMSRHFRMRPMTRDGQPVAGARVTIPVRFSLPK